MECDLNLTYSPFKLNGLRTTGPCGIYSSDIYSGKLHYNYKNYGVIMMNIILYLKTCIWNTSVTQIQAIISIHMQQSTVIISVDADMLEKV